MNVPTKNSSHKLYQSRDLLFFYHWMCQMSWRQIAKQLGVGKTTINYWAKKLNVPSRYQNNRIKLYQNRDWLYYQYWSALLSQSKIAILCNVNHGTIGKWLNNLDIPIRSNSEAIHLSKANHVNLSQEAREWIDGELLGDGHLEKRNIYSASFQYSSKYKEYINYISKILLTFGIKQSGNIRTNYYEELDCYTFHYHSLSYVELAPIRQYWYPKGKKIVPRDLKLTPLVCRQWYIGDGGLQHPRKARSYIQLYTNGFRIIDVKWLIKQMKKLVFKTTRQPSNNIIHISVSSVKDFLNYIGPCPIKCYQYKWRI